jgi:uncharacterized protein
MDDQSEVIAFLMSSATYPGRPAPVEMIETHGALVFLAGPDAYKIKRAVRYPYMDFSTLEQRRAAIAREFEINQPLAPRIYRAVVAITRAPDGGLRLGGDGPAVEWAVHMRRFDQTALMSAVAGRGELTTALAKRLADAIRDSHDRAPTCLDPSADARMHRIIAGLTRGLAEVDGALTPFRHQDFETRATQQLARVAPCLRARGAAGFVRRCHGDLHLNNLVLSNDTPTLFDAIEFDETLATIDTLYDLAFLLMDLDHRRHRAAANVVLNRYLSRSAADLDIDGLAALPLFLGMRSAIRGLVTAERALLQPEGSTARGRDLEAARSSLDDAMRYLAPPPPRLVAVGGLSGTGKSTLAAALAPTLDPAPGALHVRTDAERKAHFGVAETDRLPPQNYTRETSDVIYAKVLAKARRGLAAGHAVIVDAVFGDAGERAAIEHVASEAGVAFSGIWLTAARETLHARVTARQGDASDATAAVVDLQLARGTTATGWPQIDAGGTPEATLAAAGRLLAPGH